MKFKITIQSPGPTMQTKTYITTIFLLYGCCCCWVNFLNTWTKTYGNLSQETINQQRSALDNLGGLNEVESVQQLFNGSKVHLLHCNGIGSYPFAYRNGFS